MLRRGDAVRARLAVGDAGGWIGRPRPSLVDPRVHPLIAVPHGRIWACTIPPTSSPER